MGDLMIALLIVLAALYAVGTLGVAYAWFLDWSVERKIVRDATEGRWPWEPKDVPERRANQVAAARRAMRAPLWPVDLAHLVRDMAIDAREHK